MDDGSCVVCAEPVEWVAYGPCGHRDVCALCIARLRFVCDDRRCCICKSLSPSVFVTRASGSLTRVINDFSILPADSKDGKVGSFWYHEDTQAYFDDLDEYKIIKAMCKLSCSICDKLEAERKKSSKKRSKFKSVEQLKDHLSRQHELFLCSLCLEYKKVFISEQKLYSRVQLRQHIRCGDSEIDGSENERCGFSGHPLCEFCQRPFYGDNELYFHMSTEHYTCHICQRQQSSRYDYYKDYNDLENHFREAHFLCEDDTCLEKKFIVFSTDADMKRHIALEHGGNMSRSKRKTALQLHTCFHHREREGEDRRVRAHASFPGRSNLQHSLASSTNVRRTNSTLQHDASSVVQEISSHREGSEINATATTTTTTATVPSSGMTLDFRSVLMSGSDFPPLPGSSKRRRRKSKKKSEETGANQTAVSNPSQFRSSNSGLLLHSSQFTSPQIGSLAIAHSTSSSSVNSFHLLTPISDGIASVSSANSRTNSIEDVGSSSSASYNLVNNESTCPFVTYSTQKGDDIQAANKSLVDKICASLEFDKDKYAAFKVISQEFREGDIETGEYIAYVHQFGLAHLIADLARLCPDPQKQKELMEVHRTSLRDGNEKWPRSESGKKTAGKHSKKGKGKEKCGDSEHCSKGETLQESVLKNFKELKLNAKEPLSSKVVEHEGRSKASDDAKRSLLLLAECLTEVAGHSSGGSSNNPSGVTVTGGKKKMKKQSKFLKTRLGESSASEASDLNCSDLASDLMVVRPDQDSILASVRGVWRNGGGRRLVTLSQALPSNR